MKDLTSVAQTFLSVNTYNNFLNNTKTDVLSYLKKEKEERETQGQAFNQKAFFENYIKTNEIPQQLMNYLFYFIAESKNNFEKISNYKLVDFNKDFNVKGFFKNSQKKLVDIVNGYDFDMKTSLLNDDADFSKTKKVHNKLYSESKQYFKELIDKKNFKNFGFDENKDEDLIIYANIHNLLVSNTSVDKKNKEKVSEKLSKRIKPISKMITLSESRKMFFKKRIIDHALEANYTKQQAINLAGSEYYNPKYCGINLSPLLFEKMKSVTTV